MGSERREQRLRRGQAAFGRRDWATAVVELGALDAADGLRAADLERLARATWLVGRDAEGQELLARAHRAHLDEGDVAAAVRCAFWIGLLLIERGEVARGGGWVARGERLVAGLADAAAEHGLMLLPGSLQALQAGEPRTALEGFERALAIGQRSGDADLTVLGLLGSGQSRLVLEELEQGLALLDEAMVHVLADEVTPMLAGIVYCAVIESCRRTLQLRRAREWTSALSDWCAAQPDLVAYRGRCLVHRAQVLQLEGRWPEALDEVVRARRRFVREGGDTPVGAAWYEEAELHRLRGDAEAAERAYQRAGDAGHSPQPGLALLRLDQGEVERATNALRRVTDSSATTLEQARVLPGLVEALLASGAVGEAREAADRLADVAQQFGLDWVTAGAEQAVGAVRLAEGQPMVALAHLRRACDQWRRLDVPHEVARTQVLLARACRDVGDLDTARIEAEAARRVGSTLGARSVVRAALELLEDEDSGELPGGLTTREVEVLVQVATGKTNRAVAETLFISDKTVARHLSNIYTKLDLSSRAAATAWAYEHDLV